MKKLIILTAALLLGVGSVFAQSAWEVKVDWSYNSPFYCSPDGLPSQNYIIAIKLEIKDVANGSTIITDLNTINTVGLGLQTTTFSAAQAKVEDYCDDYHDNTPNFTVTVTVSFVELATPPTIYCFEENGDSGLSCNDFYNGVQIPVSFN